MNFIDFKTQLTDFTVFSLSDIRKINENFDLRRLAEWQQKGYIKGIIKGYYVFSDASVNEQTLFEIANKIYSPSYISLESALNFYNIIPEGVYRITSISTKRTYTFNTEEAVFSYRTLHPKLFFGYHLISDHNKTYKFAEAEKAVLDYFYLNPRINNKEDIESLRYNSDVFLKLIKKRKFRSYLRRYDSPALTRRIKLLMETMEND